MMIPKTIFRLKLPRNWELTITVLPNGKITTHLDKTLIFDFTTLHGNIPDTEFLEKINEIIRRN